METPTPEQRIIKHMNEDHELSLFVIVKSTLGRKDTYNVKNCKMTSINLKETKISYVACKNNSCSQKEVLVKFDPPMSSFADMRPRLVELHHENLEPKLSWLFTDPLCLNLLFVILLLGYANYFVDMAEIVNENVWLKPVFGSEGQIITSIIQISWIGGIGAHFVEAAYGFHLCRKKIKMRFKASGMWFLIIMMVGYPMTSKCIEFVQIQEKNQVNKNK